ncbi:MAG TPA: cupin domain-containing protein [Spirochaetota bacterium]|nr:cupin domain-containing protein [Spirochaetota bacterium]
MNYEDIIKSLNLKPHPEGGYYNETYRSDEMINSLPKRYEGNRVFSTCIYYLLTKDTFSMIHKIKSDEIFHFYMGDPVEMVNLYEDGSGKILTIGSDILKGHLPQIIVKKDVWQGAKLVDGGNFALLGTTVAPGFDFDDFETAKREQLLQKYPEFQKIILKLTK